MILLEATPQANPVGFLYVIFLIANRTRLKILKELMHPQGRTLMGDIALELEELRDILAVAPQEISTLEQMTQEVTSIVALCDGEATDPLIRPRLGEIDRRMAAAQARHTSLAHALKECRRELSADEVQRGRKNRRSIRRQGVFRRDA